MSYAARSELTEDYQAIIEIRNTVPFETTAWSLETFDPEAPIGQLLYVMLQSGNGVLSNSGKTLTVTIPVCPLDDFKLIVGSFKKIFNLTEGRIAVGAKVVAAKDLLWNKTFPGGQSQGIATSGTTGPALVFFNSTRIPTSIGGNHSAKLYKGDQLRCFAFGTTFEKVDGTLSNGTGAVWPYSGVLFYRFGWIGTPPVEPEDLTMIVEAGTRPSGKTKFRFEVTLSGTETIGPISEIFDVKPGQTFTLDDGYLR